MGISYKKVKLFCNSLVFLALNELINFKNQTNEQLEIESRGRAKPLLYVSAISKF